MAACEDAAAWVAAGESGYVNCLLTVLAEGTVRTATVAVGKPLPRLDTLAGDEPSVRDWAERLRFRSESLSVEAILSILTESFEVRAASSGTLKTVLVRSDGSPLAVLFTAAVVGATRGTGGHRAASAVRRGSDIGWLAWQPTDVPWHGKGPW